MGLLITKEFPGVKALSDVNLDVKRGEIHAIYGENGAGKLTLMKVLSAVYPDGTYEGQIFGSPDSLWRIGLSSVVETLRLTTSGHGPLMAV